MAKGKKKNTEQVTGAPAQPQQAAAGGASQQQQQQSLVPLFPLRPPRPPNEKPPGRPVMLLTNMFKLSLKQNKPIYTYGVTVDMEFEGDQGDDASKPAQPRKLGNEIRRSAVETAIKKWISENKPKDFDKQLTYNYLFDANGSVVYTLFNMFAQASGSTAADGRQYQEFRISIKLDAIVDEKLGKVEKFFRVKIFRGEKLDLQFVFDFCRGQGSSNITLIQEHLRALNVILRGKIITIPSNVVTPLNVFPYKKENQTNISPGYMINKGYSISARPTECGLVMNVANSVGVFHEEIDLVELLRSRFSVKDFNRPLHNDVIERFKKEIFGKNVEARHINYGTPQKPHFRKYRVTDVSGSCNDKFTLVDKESKTTTQVSIQQYFKDKYKINIKFPALPCIIDKGRKLPIEICHLIEKQRVLRKLEPDEVAEVIKKASVPPNQHFAEIRKNLGEIQANSQPLQDFGLEFEPRPIDVEGRELPPISLVGGRGREIRPRDGQYDTRGVPFFKPAKVNSWCMMFLMDERVADAKRANGPNELFSKKFSDLYCRGALDMGVVVPAIKETNYIDLGAFRNKDIELRQNLKKYFGYLNQNKVDHCIIVLPQRCPDWMYRYIQYLEASITDHKRAPGESWTRTSCIKYSNYHMKILNGKDFGRMFISNLWLKYNTKLGGINFVLKENPQDKTYSFLSDDNLFISVDVCHPAPGDKLIQSVAAVVGMWDLTNINMSHCTRLKVQKKTRENHSTVEEVGEVGSMFEGVLQSYYMKKKKLPKRIIVLRDGVSEGQFERVLKYELTKVKSNLQNRYTLMKLPPPTLTFLVVQKRHKVRFMRQQPAEGRRGPDYNIQPGTVVDSKIVHPKDFSFYLAPHKAIQGTSRAPHIYMIYDDNKFSQDQAQAMVHALSYLSPRCTKSTSIPTPVNLADLAAEQGKNIVISWSDDQRGMKMDEKEKLEKLNKLLDNLGDVNYKNTLYYI